MDGTTKEFESATNDDQLKKDIVIIKICVIVITVIMTISAVSTIYVASKIGSYFSDVESVYSYPEYDDNDY